MSDDLKIITALAKAILAAGELDHLPWTVFSLVIEFDDLRRPDGSYGYAYARDGAFTAFAIDMEEPIEEAASACVDAAGWKERGGLRKMLVQFDRQSQKCVLQFATDSERWKITPDNLRAMIGELRPDFG